MRSTGARNRRETIRRERIDRRRPIWEGGAMEEGEGAEVGNLKDWFQSDVENKGGRWLQRLNGT